MPEDTSFTPAGSGAPEVGRITMLPEDMAAMLAQLRETIGNLDRVLAAVHETAD
jgi:hypothetical protein